jgi:hypothetical protein
MIKNFFFYLFNSFISVDGLALGAAASSTQSDVKMIVFIAIMLHKVSLIA